MYAIKKMFSHLFYNQNWNIGFTDDTVDSLFKNKALARIQWMKHNYRDRIFADPFVLKTNAEKIFLLAEEMKFSENKGKIVKLEVDKRTKKLRRRTIFLELDSHLSYPAIIRGDKRTFIYPENSKGGCLKLYVYESESDTISYYRSIIEEPLNDATITYLHGKYWLIATKKPFSQEKAFLYTSNSFDGIYRRSANNPIIINRKSARPAGNFITYGNKLFRPAQDCSKRYGSGICIQEIEKMDETDYKEKTVIELKPQSFKYNLGLHTINFFNGGCVVDGYGYLYPIAGRIYNLLTLVYKKLLYGTFWRFNIKTDDI